jgi:hypothetical protein
VVVVTGVCDAGLRHHVLAARTVAGNMLPVAKLGHSGCAHLHLLYQLLPDWLWERWELVQLGKEVHGNSIHLMLCTAGWVLGPILKQLDGFLPGSYGFDSHVVGQWRFRATTRLV